MGVYVGWSTVMTAVRDHGAPLVDDPDRTAGVAALGMDETAFLAANQDHHVAVRRARHHSASAAVA